MVRPGGVEPSTFGSVDQRSIQLSYERIHKYVLHYIILSIKCKKLGIYHFIYFFVNIMKYICYNFLRVVGK